MDSDDGENIDYGEEIDEKTHDRLVENVLSLNKAQHVKKPTRTEPTLQISEFDLVKSITGEKGTIKVNELTQALKNRKNHVKIGKKVQSTSKKAQTLPKPLEKPQAERIRRAVAYEKNRLKLDKWEPIVTSNRVAPHLSFPLDHNPKIEIKEAKELTKMWRTKSKLQEELEKIEPIVEVTEVEVKEEKVPVTMKKMIEHRKQMAKTRALQSYQEAKARRLKKIKSKRYHRTERRRKIKEQIKEFEILKRENPEEALRKLEDIDRIRAEERFNLRHRNTGQWAKNKMVRAKFDKESREELAQQLRINKELTRELKSATMDSDDDYEIVKENVDSNPQKIDLSNAWDTVEPGQEVTDFVTSYKKFWLQQNESRTQNADAGNKKCHQVIENEIDGETDNEINDHDEDNIDKNSGDSANSCQDNVTVEENKTNHVETDKNTKLATKKKNSTKIKNATPNTNDDRKNVKGTKRKRKNEKIQDANATSDWDVSELDIEDIFQKLEDKLERKMKKKVKNIKKDVVKEQKKENMLNEINIEGRKRENNKIDLTLPRQKKRPVLDEELIETSIDHSGESFKETLVDPKEKDFNLKMRIEGKKDDTKTKMKTNGTNTVEKVTELQFQIAQSTAADMIENDEEEDDQRNNVMDNYEDEDGLEEFSKEKKEEIEKGLPKDIDLTLPGWGSWGGTGINVSKRKRKRFITRMPKAVPRRDDNKGMVIINEKAQSKVRELKVSEVPFPFTSVKDFEASLRAPIGRTFVPETAFKRLIKPAVTTKMGTIIEPMSRDVLINN